jgi:hypothetical protein
MCAMGRDLFIIGGEHDAQLYSTDSSSWLVLPNTALLKAPALAIY